MSIDPEKLRRSLEAIEAMPDEELDSYLAEVAPHVLRLRAKKMPYRKILTYLAREFDLHPALSTLHRFARRAKQQACRKARAAKSIGKKHHPCIDNNDQATRQNAQVEKERSEPPTTLPDAHKPETDPKARRAIRLLKAKASVAETIKEPEPYFFDKKKPLITELTQQK